MLLARQQLVVPDPWSQSALHDAPHVCPSPLSQTYGMPCRRLAGSGAGDVFMTDDVLAALMCAPRSNYPWVRPPEYMPGQQAQRECHGHDAASQTMTTAAVSTAPHVVCKLLAAVVVSQVLQPPVMASF